GARVPGDAVPRPPIGGDREGLLRGFLGEVEVAEEADQGREDVAPLIAEDALEGRYHWTVGRTSIAPPRRAAGILEASSIAASRSSASNRRYPPIASLISTNGPSVISVVASNTPTAVAASGGCAAHKHLPADPLLDRDDRAVGDQRRAVLHPHGRRRLGRRQLEAGCHAGG